MKKYMFDTVTFNRILDETCNIDFRKSDYSFYVTHVQVDELSNTPDQERKEKLLRIFKLVGSSKIPTESFLLDTSRLNEAKLSGGELHKRIIGRMKPHKNNPKDALIGEAAIKNGCILVTDDDELFKAVNAESGTAIKFSELHM